jgi:hypothetical protein
MGLRAHLWELAEPALMRMAATKGLQ